LLLATIVLVAASPIMLIETALVHSDSRGPVLFFHQRRNLQVRLQARDNRSRTFFLGRGASVGSEIYPNKKRGARS